MIYQLACAVLSGSGTILPRPPAVLDARPLGSGLGGHPSAPTAAQHWGRPEERLRAQPTSRPAGPGHAEASRKKPGKIFFLKTRLRNMQPHIHISILQLVCVWWINPDKQSECVQTLHRKPSPGSKCNHPFDPHLDCMHAARTRTFLVPNPINLLQMVAIKTVKDVKTKVTWTGLLMSNQA